MKEVLWNISISSQSEDMGLTKEEINYLMTLFNDPEYRKDYIHIKEQVRNAHPDSKVAIWQCDKGVEIDKLFEDNLKFDISNDEVHIVCDYNVYFTQSFDEGDVSCWATGLHHLSQILPQIEMKNIIRSYENELEVIYNRVKYNKYKDFLQALQKNQIINFTKISK